MSRDPNPTTGSARRGRAYVFGKPAPVGVAVRYVLLVALLMTTVFPLLWQLGTSFKGAGENIYSFPPSLVPTQPTLDNYAAVTRVVPVLRYAWHSLLLGVGTAASNVLLATLAGYVLGCTSFRGKRIVVGLLLSTLLLPGEVTLTSQYTTIRTLGLADSLWGVFLPGAVGTINVLLITTACRMIPTELLDASAIDGTTTLQRIRHVVWPNIRGMVTVVALFSFIGAWDDFLWPLVVLSDPANYTLTVGMQYLSSSVVGTNPRVVAAGTMIALLPVVVLFATLQKYFFAGVEEGGVKG